MKNGLDISSFGATDTGCVRENNEDTLITMQLWDMRHTLLVAIDGMGGEEGGEVAAEIARKTIIEFLTNNRDGSVLGLLKQAMALANNEIVKAAEEDPRLHRMGGTEWVKAKARAKKSVEDIAQKLIEIYFTATRTASSPSSPTTTAWWATRRSRDSSPRSRPCTIRAAR